MRVYQFRHIRADGQCSHLFPEISRHGCLSAERCRRSVGESMTSPPAHGDGRTIFLIDGWSAYRRSLRLFVEAAGYRVVGEADSISAAAAHVGLGAADVVILDPGWEWRDVRADLARLRDANHAVAIVLLTAAPLATDVARQAHGASVDAQLTKEASPRGDSCHCGDRTARKPDRPEPRPPPPLGATEPDSSGARDPDARRSRDSPTTSSATFCGSPSNRFASIS